MGCFTNDNGVLICGQSNAGFRSNSSGLPLELQSAQPGTFYWAHFTNAALHSSGAVIEMQPIDDLHGVQITLAQRLKQVGQTPLIMQIGTASTDLANEWLPFSGAQYTNLLTRFQAALTDHNGVTSTKLRHIVWIQGEADAQVEAEANAYESNLTTFFNAVRYLGPKRSTVHAHVIRLNSGTTFTFKNTVRTAQENFVTNDGNASLVNTDDISLGPDDVHYTSAGYQTLGTRIADSIINAG